jgi:hypothetical protein
MKKAGAALQTFFNINPYPPSSTTPFLPTADLFFQGCNSRRNTIPVRDKTADAASSLLEVT